MEKIRGIFKKIAAFLAAKKKKIGILGAGWTFDRLNNWIFEYVVYPVVIGYFGLLAGAGIMIFLSIVLSAAMLFAYDKTKRDWLGIEAIKSLRDEDQSNRWIKFIGWLMKKGDLVALVGLSLISEPVKVTLYLRHGSNQFNGFSGRDKIIFFSSVIIGNVSWALAVYAGINIFKEVIKIITG